jgi:hypothetical protein
MGKGFSNGALFFGLGFIGLRGIEGFLFCPSGF